MKPLGNWLLVPALGVEPSLDMLRADGRSSQRPGEVSRVPSPVLIPLGTERPTGRRAVVTPAIIGLTVVCFAAFAVLEAVNPQLALRIQMAGWVMGGENWTWWGPFTSTLLHGGLLHLAGNMLFLWVFGPSVEDRFGRLGFLLLYLGSALIAGSLHALVEDAPAIGASGAIAGVTGSFLVLFPRTTVRCFTLLGFGVIGLPAWWFVGFAIAWDIFSQGLGARTGVAHAAHLGGYLAGFGTSMLLLALRVFPREPYDLFTIFRQAHRRRQFREAGAMREKDVQRLVRKAQAQLKEEAEADPLRQAMSQARLRVGSAASRGELEEAARAYQQMIKTFGADSRGVIMTRRVQYDVANQLYKMGEHESAATAYQGFLSTAPDDREAPTVRLMLGVLMARYLDRPSEAREHLTQAMDELNEDQQALAKEILEELE